MNGLKAQNCSVELGRGGRVNNDSARPYNIVNRMQNALVLPCKSPYSEILRRLISNFLFFLLQIQSCDIQIREWYLKDPG